MRKPDSEVFKYRGFRLGRRGNAYVADYRNEDGRRRRPKLGTFESKDDAQKALRNYADSVLALKQRTKEYTIGELWNLWLEDREHDGFDNTIYKFNWRSLRPHFAHIIAKELDAQTCRDYAQLRFDTGRSPSTVHTELSRLRTCVHWATKHKFLKKDDEPHVWAPAKGGARQRVLTPEEARKLLENAVSPHIQLFIILALSTGARHTAILDLMWNRIDFEKGVIDYEESVEANPMSRSYKKGRAQVPMNNLARTALERAYAGRLTDYVVEWSGKRLHDIREGFALAVERAGLPGKVTPHTLRHTVTTWARERGIDKSRVANLLGHADERTQDLVYFHPEATTYLGEAVRTIEGALGDKYALPELQPKGVKPSERIREKRNRMSQRDK